MTSRMHAIRQHRLGGPEVLEYVELPRPVPGRGEVLVRIAAAGVNPADWKIRAGLVRRGEPPLTLGMDLAGEVAGLGAEVSGFALGDQVFGCARPPGGSYAEYAVVAADGLTLRPGELDEVQAAALPVAALTAWQSLVRAAEVRAGQRVLVHAAAGGVGHYAVQIAKAHGAHVIGTARSGKHEFLRRLGADELIDYTTTDFTDAVSDVDIVIDPLSADYGLRSLRVLAPHGQLIDVRGTGPDRTELIAAAAAADIRYVQFGFQPSGADLAQIAALVTSGSLRVTVDTVLPLADAAAAHRLSESGRTTGKIVLVP